MGMVKWGNALRFLQPHSAASWSNGDGTAPDNDLAAAGGEVLQYGLLRIHNYVRTWKVRQPPLTNGGPPPASAQKTSPLAGWGRSRAPGKTAVTGVRSSSSMNVARSGCVTTTTMCVRSTYGLQIYTICIDCTQTSKGAGHLLSVVCASSMCPRLSRKKANMVLDSLKRHCLGQIIGAQTYAGYVGTVHYVTFV